MTLDAIREAIVNLKDGECFTWPSSDYGLAEIYSKHDALFIFSIPMYGGEPVYESVFIKARVDDLIEFVLSWT